MNTQNNKGKDNSTKDRLIHEARKLFAELGYDATTTRMIANKTGISQSAISFHFTTKENLCKCVVEYTACQIAAAYDSMCHEIEQAYQDGVITRDLAWSYINKLLLHQIHYSFNQRNRNIIGLVLRESSFPPQIAGILSKIIFEKIEGPLTRLIVTVSGRDDFFWAAVISRTINGSILTFAEHPLLLKNVIQTTNPSDSGGSNTNFFVTLKAVMQTTDSLDQSDLIISYIHEYLVGGIKAIIAQNNVSVDSSSPLIGLGK